MEPKPRKIQNFVSIHGIAPFEEWFVKLRDKSAQARIAARIDRLRFGNFGDCKSVGAGVFELRIHIGPGYRVYFGLVGSEVVLLLGGGDKSTQHKNIATAQKHWKEFKNGKA